MNNSPGDVPTPSQPVINKLLKQQQKQPEPALVSANPNGNLSGDSPLWIFVYAYAAANLTECTEVFRRREKCEQFAVDYLAKIYAYHFRPTGNPGHDLAVLLNIWLTSDQTDIWYIKECSSIIE